MTSTVLPQLSRELGSLATSPAAGDSRASPKKIPYPHTLGMTLEGVSPWKGGSKSQFVAPVPCSWCVPLVTITFAHETTILPLSLAGLVAQRCSLARSAGVILCGAHTQDYSFEKGGNMGAWLKGTK